MRQLTRASRIFSFALVGALLALTAACGSSSSSSPSNSGSSPNKTGGVATLNINVGDASFVKTLDPALPTDSVSYYDIQLVNANLVKFSYPSLQVKPDLATWTVTPNHMVYTFTIRQNAKFANGDPVTAQDAAWSMTRALLPATKSPVAALYLGPIKGAAELAAGKAKTLTGVKVTGPRTLQITLTGPYAYFLGSLTYPTADVLDPKVMQGKSPSYLTNTCSGNQGAGPFEFVCQGKGSGPTSFYPSGHSPFFKFKPNPNYYGPKATITINAPFISDNEQNWRLFESGAIDNTVVPTADITRAKDMPGVTKQPALITDYITPNQQMAPFNNKSCRLAVAYAIDRVGITQKLLKGTEGPLYDVIPPGLPNGGQGYFGQEPDVPYYNPTVAKHYLASCPGHLNGVVLTYQATGQDIAHEYDTVRANLASIGANITLKPLTFNAWLNVVGQTMQATHTQITENLWIDDYPDAQDWLAQLLQTGANYDIGGYSNKTYDNLINQGNVQFNVAQRAATYRKAMKLPLQDGAWISVGYASPVWVVKPKLHNLMFTDGNIYPLNGDWSKVSVG